MCIRDSTYNDVINVNTKKGNAVIMSEEEYNGLMETLHIAAVPGLTAVSYTHLDVYKRQAYDNVPKQFYIK